MQNLDLLFFFLLLFHTLQPLVRPMTCATSPTSVATTGTLHAIASFTMLGDPSANDGRMSALLALMYCTTVVCGRPLATTSSADIPLACRHSTAACANGKFFTGMRGSLPKRT